jgi:lipid-binding SYLF domain-containing protein
LSHPNQIDPVGRDISMFRALLVTAILASIVPASFAAAPDPDEIINAADLALQRIMSDSEAAIPQEVLADAHGLIIWPERTDFKLIAGARFRTGVLLTRTADRSWNRPKFVRQRMGSVGLQAGYVRGSEIQVYLTRKKLDEFVKNGSLLLGVGIGGRLNESLHQRASDAINANPNSVIQCYSSGTGMSGGAMLQSDFRKVDPKVEAAYYAEPDHLPEAASQLMANLEKYCRCDKVEAIQPHAVAEN